MYIITSFDLYHYLSFPPPGDTQASPVLEAGIRLYVAAACKTMDARTWVLWERYVSCCMLPNPTSTQLSLSTQVDNLFKSLFLKWKENGDIKIENGHIVYVTEFETLVTEICEDVRQAYDLFSMDLKNIKVTKGCSEAIEKVMKEANVDYSDEFFGMSWNLETSECLPNFCLTLYKKAKGAKTGKDLHEMSESDIKEEFPQGITRRQITRLHMGTYSILGRECGPALAVCKVLAKKVTDLNIPWDAVLRE